MKLQKKLLLSFLVLLAVPFFFMLGYFQLKFVEELEDRTLAMEEVIVGQVASAVDNYMKQMEGIASGIAQSEEIQKLLACTEQQLEVLWDQEEERDRLFTYLENLKRQSGAGMISDIRIYCEPGHPLFSKSMLRESGIFVSTEKIATTLWYGNMQEEGVHELAASAFYENSWEGKEGDTVAWIRKITYYTKNKPQNAYAAVYFKRAYLEEVLGGYGNYPNSCIYIIDEKECLVAQQGQDVVDAFILSYQDIQKLMPKERQFCQVDYGSHVAWSLYRNMGHMNWRLVFAVSKSAVTAKAQRDAWMFMALYLAVGGLLLIPVLLISRSITRRVIRLKERMEEVRNAPPRQVSGWAGRDEIGALTESYNYMVKQIHALLKERVEITRENNAMEMNLLRSQINPHFLYNTLDMISWYAVKGDTKSVTDSIQTLAKFYRLSLNHGELLTTLDREIQLIQQYVELQSRRVLCEISLLVDIPDSMLEIQIPQFLLQPLVENSLKHGILEKEEPEGVIGISGWMETRELVLLLYDDGVGMSAVQLEQMRESKMREGHIGVQNIYRRLELFYGKGGFSMEYESTPGEGTQVELHLPYEILKKEEEADG